VTEPGPDWIEQARRFAAGLASEHAGTGLPGVLGGLLTGAAAAPDGEDHGAECRNCPVCTALAALRGRRPDLLEALADVLATASTALRASAARATPDGSAAPTATAPPEETVPHPAPAPAVQKIDVA
jgi:hypothetical protein